MVEYEEEGQPHKEKPAQRSMLRTKAIIKAMTKVINTIEDNSKECEAKGEEKDNDNSEEEMMTTSQEEHNAYVEVECKVECKVESEDNNKRQGHGYANGPANIDKLAGHEDKGRANWKMAKGKKLSISRVKGGRITKGKGSKTGNQEMSIGKGKESGAGSQEKSIGKGKGSGGGSQETSLSKGSTSRATSTGRGDGETLTMACPLLSLDIQVSY
ncbi:hypothetical protein C0995_009015 [Termitomyces sp. Mi166|nr:hypothetical protein C0995_009015 [Termitomyces sp. Mi166\